jgi:hypothetical protein
VSIRRAAIVAGIGLTITLSAAVVLALNGALAGPSLWHGSGAIEAPLLAIAGGLWGWRMASRRRAGILRVFARQ